MRPAWRGARPGVRIVNTARGELIDEAALADAIESRHVAGAGLDVFESEPPTEWRLAKLPQVIATPHIAASTAEAQEQVGLETAVALRDFLREGVIRNAVNFRGIRGDEFARVRPFMVLAERVGMLVSQIAEGRTQAIGVRYYGPLVCRTRGPDCQLGRGRRSSADAVVERDSRERARNRRGTRHRSHRVSQLEASRAGQYPVGQAAHDQTANAGSKELCSKVTVRA